jgi:hypothetical protein
MQPIQSTAENRRKLSFGKFGNATKHYRRGRFGRFAGQSRPKMPSGGGGDVTSSAAVVMSGEYQGDIVVSAA